MEENPIDVLEAAIKEQRQRDLQRPEPSMESLRNIYTGHINGYNKVLRMIHRMRKGLPPLKDTST